MFLFAGCDVGYAVPYVKFPFVVYTGLDFKLWYRDLTPLVDTQGVLYYNTDAGNSETYYWFSLPLGIFVTKPMSPRYVLGADACVTYMFFGGMKVDGGPSANYPAVTLGNRASCKIELFVEKKKDNGPSVRFAPYFMFYTFGRSNTDSATDGTVF